jgi:hypothetical protein
MLSDTQSEAAKITGISGDIGCDFNIMGRFGIRHGRNAPMAFTAGLTASEHT